MSGRASCLLVAWLLIAGCGKEEPPKPAAQAPAAPTVTVKIGIVAPLTGPQSHIGKDMENAVRLAADDANGQKIMIGANQLKFEVQAEDDQADPRTATTVAQRLVDAGVKGVIGHVTSGASIPASRIYEQAGIPAMVFVNKVDTLGDEQIRDTLAALLEEIEKNLQATHTRLFKKTYCMPINK